MPSFALVITSFDVKYGGIVTMNYKLIIGLGEKDKKRRLPSGG